jgi:nucleoside 2-deoxyribosyltransferase
VCSSDLICPVRNASEEQIKKLRDYKLKLQSEGHTVYYPTDNNPYELTDKIGYKICVENTRAIREADEIHLFWDANSRGSLFDLGSAFALNKPLTIVNPESVEPTENKSFANMISEWSNK